MKKLFYAALAGLALFEILNVYFIMPMPGSQHADTVGLAYFLYSWRWPIRGMLALLMLAGIRRALRPERKWIPAIAITAVAGVVYVFNFRMTADCMFLEPESAIFKPKSGNRVSGSRLVIGIEYGGEAKAYPVAFLAYHHQVRDVIGGKPVMVTYCSVCRTGRVFEPVVEGRLEAFRLVGMDHFNAMFEDATTGSWWYQATGEAVAGRMKGRSLPEVPSRQMTIDKWFEIYPQGTVMQPDEGSIMEYDSLARFEQGKSKSGLTRTDSLSWNDKSWVVGVRAGNACKAYDWNDLKANGIIHDTIGPVSVLVFLSSDANSFSAFERPAGARFSVRHDTLLTGDFIYDFTGKNLTGGTNLASLAAYQEFWHSWKAFHPETGRYMPPHPGQ